MATFNKKKTKIVCTMGPATEDEEVLRQLILHGMNVARFNFSHGNHEYHRKNIERVRALSRELSIPVAIMLDTKGPEVRTGVLKDGEKVQLDTGKTCIVTTDDDVIGTAERFSLDYKPLPTEVQPGTVILIDDGLIGLEVDHVEGTDIHCRITNGGLLGEHKGVNFPNLNINLPSVTAQDRADIMFGCELGIDAHRRVLHPRRQGRGGDPQDLRGDGRARRPHLPQDRERPRRQELRRDPARVRRLHGGPRRPRRGGARRAGPAHPEDHHQEVQAALQARHHGHADARLHAAQPAPHARRGQRRRQRRLRRHGLRHALRRDRGRQVPDRGRQDHVRDLQGDREVPARAPRVLRTAAASATSTAPPASPRSRWPTTWAPSASWPPPTPAAPRA